MNLSPLCMEALREAGAILAVGPDNTSDLEKGAVLVVDPEGSRVRLLPLPERS
jgi:hypothetical protein